MAAGSEIVVLNVGLEWGAGERRVHGTGDRVQGVRSGCWRARGEWRRGEGNVSERVC